MKFSVTTNLFYEDSLTYANLPSDAISVDSETETSLRIARKQNLPIAQKDNGEFVIGSSDCDVWNEGNQCFDLDETAMRLEVKEAHKAAVNAAADAIRDGWLLCDTDPAPEAPVLNKSFYGSEFNRTLLASKQNVIQRKTAEVLAEFPSLWVKTGKGDTDEYEIIASDVEPMYDAVEFTTQALVNLYVEIKNNQILPDFNDGTLSLEDFEAKDYVNDVGAFMDLFTAKTADAKVYAQPENEPSAI